MCIGLNSSILSTKSNLHVYTLYHGSHKGNTKKKSHFTSGIAKENDKHRPSHMWPIWQPTVTFAFNVYSHAYCIWLLYYIENIIYIHVFNGVFHQVHVFLERITWNAHIQLHYDSVWSDPCIEQRFKWHLTFKFGSLFRVSSLIHAYIKSKT